MIRIVLPTHLRTLAGVPKPVSLDVDGPLTQRTLLDALESSYPVLKGTIRDPRSLQRRPFVRFFVGEEDWSHASPDEPLPDEVAVGDEPFVVIGAMAGG